MSILQHWSDLPDPRPENQGRPLGVDFAEWAWRHCVKHWTAHDEPWKEEFGAGTVTQLGTADGKVPADPAAVNQVLNVLREQAAESLRRPLVLLLRQRGRASKGLQWLLVLPSGALAVLRGNHSSARWVTCYYLRAAAVEKRRRLRWQITVRRLVRRYVPIQGNPPQCLLPGPDQEISVVKKGTYVERVRSLRFITPANWGFCEELNGIPWRGRLTSWPAAEPSADAPTIRKRRLKKARFHWEEEFDPQS
ncbi:MAG: hypothetical protein GYA33_14070 [Thermogutta sp.]|nr:hypothetical protein [Thermogutta sp.]